MKNLAKILYFQVIVAFVLSILFGIFFPDYAIKMKPISDAFIKLIKMLICPLLFCTIVHSIAENENLNISKLGIKMIIYFELITTLALVIGLLVANVIKPGNNIKIDPSSFDSSVIQKYTNQSEQHSIYNFLIDIIPNTMTEAFSSGKVLSVIFIAILFGFALLSVKDNAKSVINFVYEFSLVIFKIFHFITKLAPIGVFCAMSYTIAKYGVESLTGLTFLIISFYITCFLFIIFVLGFITKICGVNIFAFIRYLKEEILLVLGTSSSESALPSLISKLEKIGCDKSIVRIVVPSGYSFNLDGTCIYFTMAIVFIAQALNIELTIWQEISIISVLLFVSKGAAGVTGSGFVTLASALSIMNDTIPVESIGIILGIDRFMSEARSVTNLIGNSIATLAISKWEGKLDVEENLLYSNKIDQPNLDQQ